jgi:acyl carrier protein
MDFLDLPCDIKAEDLTQKAISAWNALASVQLTAELQGAFHVDFDLDIESLGKYDGISAAPCKKGISIDRLGSKQSADLEMKQITPEIIQQFLLVKYLDRIESIGMNPAEISDDFDLLLSGVIDSFGILEMISSIEEEFQVELDLAALDAEQITIVGPLSRFVAGNAKPNI